MARVDAPAFDPRWIIVLPHAVARALERCPDLPSRREADVRAELARRVERALKTGQVYDVRPKAWQRPYVGSRPPRGRRGVLAPGQRFVVCLGGRSGTDTGFVIDVGMAPQIQVITTLTPLG